jgi:hypothetical protein
MPRQVGVFCIFCIPLSLLVADVSGKADANDLLIFPALRLRASAALRGFLQQEYCRDTHSQLMDKCPISGDFLAEALS